MNVWTVSSTLSALQKETRQDGRNHHPEGAAIFAEVSREESLAGPRLRRSAPLHIIFDTLLLDRAVAAGLHRGHFNLVGTPASGTSVEGSSSERCLFDRQIL